MVAYSRWRKILVWIFAAFSAFGVVLGVSTLAVVWFVMDTFRRDARLDPAAISHEQNVMLVALALIVTVAAINIVAGLVLLLKRAQQSG
jgi:ABC-type lipoprotein release transport system permease subunit